MPEIAQIPIYTHPPQALTVMAGMSDSFEIRPVCDEDVEPLVKLWTMTGLTRPWNDPRQDIAFARSRPNSTILAAYMSGVLVASAMTGHDGHRGALYYVAVSPDRQGLGLGRAIVRAAESWLRAQGVWKVNLLIRRENEAVLAFYRQLGYEPGDTIQLGHRIDAQE